MTPRIQLNVYHVRFDLLSEDETRLIAETTNAINVAAFNVERAIQLAQWIAPTLRYGAVEQNLHVADVAIVQRDVYIDLEEANAAVKERTR